MQDAGGELLLMGILRSSHTRSSKKLRQVLYRIILTLLRNTAGLTSPTPRIKKVFLCEAQDESPAHYQEIHGDIYDDYVGSSDTAID
jgi:hypothetical protein